MEEIINEVKGFITGEKSVGYYIGALFFSTLAILISLYARGKQKFKQSTDTPERFSWYFLIWDNTKRIASGLTVMYLIYRFTPTVSMELAVGVGFFVSVGVDRAIQWLQTKFDFLNMNRDNLPTKPQS